MTTLAAPKSADAAIASRARRSISGALASTTRRSRTSVALTRRHIVAALAVHRAGADGEVVGVAEQGSLEAGVLDRRRGVGHRGHDVAVDRRRGDVVDGVVADRHAVVAGGARVVGARQGRPAQPVGVERPAQDAGVAAGDEVAGGVELEPDLAVGLEVAGGGARGPRTLRSILLGMVPGSMATRPAPVDFNPIARIGREFRDERALDGDLPPGDLGLSVKRARRFVGDPLGLLLDSYRRYGPIFTLRMGTTPTVWLIGPEANHFMLVSGTRHFTWRDGFMGDLIPLVGDGLLTTDGDYHDRARKALTPAFHRRALEGSTRVMLEEADAALDAIRPGADLDAYTWTRRLALGIAMRALFGMEADGERRERIAERFERALSFYYRPVWEVMLRGPGSPWARMQREKARLDDLVLEEIARRRRRGGGDD